LIFGAFLRTGALVTSNGHADESIKPEALPEDFYQSLLSPSQNNTAYEERKGHDNKARKAPLKSSTATELPNEFLSDEKGFRDNFKNLPNIMVQKRRMIWDAKEMSAKERKLWVKEELEKVPYLYAGCPELCATWQSMRSKKPWTAVDKRAASKRAASKCAGDELAELLIPWRKQDADKPSSLSSSRMLPNGSSHTAMGPPSSRVGVGVGAFVGVGVGVGISSASSSSSSPAAAVAAAVASSSSASSSSASSSSASSSPASSSSSSSSSAAAADKPAADGRAAPDSDSFESESDSDDCSSGGNDASGADSSDSSSVSESNMSETDEEQVAIDEEPEPIRDNFQLDVKQPEDPMHINFVSPTNDLTLADKLKQLQARMNT
jgi:hypothetical protein